MTTPEKPEKKHKRKRTKRKVRKAREWWVSVYGTKSGVPYLLSYSSWESAMHCCYDDPSKIFKVREVL